MRKFIVILCLLCLCVCSCRTLHTETVRWQTVEVHDTTYQVKLMHDSITLHDSVYIHQKGDTVYSERWHVKHAWHTKTDTVYRLREIPYVVTDTICKIREVPVEKKVYEQRWWQKALSTIGVLFLLGMGGSLIIHRFK